MIRFWYFFALAFRYELLCNFLLVLQHTIALLHVENVPFCFENEKKSDDNHSILISAPPWARKFARKIILIHVRIINILPSTLGVVVTIISSPKTMSESATFTGSMLALSRPKISSTVSSFTPRCKNL